MTPLGTPPDTISQELFDQYTANWLSVVNQPDGAQLAQAFLGADAARLLYVSFSSKRIVWLLSAVGVRLVKARFLLIPNSTDGKLRFSLTLFAADGQGNRVSAYYLADQYGDKMPEDFQLDEKVPRSLAAIWLNNWKAVSGVTPALFASTLGPLQGYNFEVEEFIAPLFDSPSFDKQEIRLYLALHEYHAADAIGTKVNQTFGLVVRAYHPDKVGGTVGDDDFYDMATPCPPAH